MNLEEKIAGEFNHFLKIMNHKEEGKLDESLSENEKRHSISLMRVNASGEVAAQALYRGQAFFAKSKKVKKHLLKAGEEEFRHLKWCDKRLKELGGKKSLLDPFYYAGSFTLGSIAAFFGDEKSLGFIEETEKQVVKHLEGHLDEMSPSDKKSREILKKMIDEEEEHGKEAKDHGGEELPAVVKGLMKITAKSMTTLSRYI
ncbi:MAG: demethoxyubiquinone hydroxylase family protein [SAR86 cluster bacterium]|jgi:ubiquinone biosynthesis monooxygenase Coq7|nr:MAG: demethoxyubiquinone hydroxylase family protein [SAR86 cluster bacterium]|tara:strand:- start:170 stop:772 length:603 start_codon:yes stop_codon:yes gene_type:complete